MQDPDGYSIEVDDHRLGFPRGMSRVSFGIAPGKLTLLTGTNPAWR